MIFFFKYWDNDILDHPGLTCQIYEPRHKIMINLYKANKNKLWMSISNEPNVEEKTWKKNLKRQKNNMIQHEFTFQTQNLDHKIGIIS